MAAGTVLTARVGYQSEASSLAISGGDSGDTVTAQPGQNGYNYNAQWGYGLRLRLY